MQLNICDIPVIGIWFRLEFLIDPLVTYFIYFQLLESLIFSSIFLIPPFRYVIQRNLFDKHQ